jgi:hypothetical protein
VLGGRGVELAPVPEVVPAIGGVDNAVEDGVEVGVPAAWTRTVTCAVAP